MGVRTRFAPSPTGHLHVGSVRTALFSWLYAKHHQGEFLLRIEDTDSVRSTQASVDGILQSLDWLGLASDGPIVFQSKRYERYQSIIDTWLAEGKAYRCTCSQTRLDELRASQMQQKLKPRYDGHCRGLNHPEKDEPYVVRFKTPQSGTVRFKDEVYGDITVENNGLDDLIIKRSDGHPTYNFVVVVDDSDMDITHVIRGDDHINNTPRQIHLYQALGAPIPTFAHLPMILGEDTKRLSKRHGAVSVLEFKAAGILPQALLNYLVRLGWAYGDQEIFSLEEMIQYFDLNGVSRAAASFNYEKLYWLNQHYQKNCPAEEVAVALVEHFAQDNIDLSQGPPLAEVVQAQAERCKTLVDMKESSLYFYQETILIDPSAAKKHFRPVILSPMEHLLDLFSKITVWEKDALQNCINDTCAEFNLNMGKIAQPLRVAITGSSSSPAIDVTLELIGKKRVLARMEEALKMIRERKQASESS